MQSGTSLTLKNLSLERGERRLCKAFNLHLEPGQAVRILGINGAGKSSLMKAILGLISVSAGDILWAGQSVLNNREALLKKSLYLGHQSGVKALLTVEENLRYFAPSASRHQREQALENFQLTALAEAQVQSLSAGQARRVALCRLCLTKAHLWLLDEPFTSLDKQAIETLERLISAHLAQGGMLVFSSHQAPLSFVSQQVSLSS